MAGVQLRWCSTTRCTGAAEADERNADKSRLVLDSFELTSVAPRDAALSGPDAQLFVAAANLLAGLVPAPVAVTTTVAIPTLDSGPGCGQPAS